MNKEAHRIVRVELGPQSYDIVIGHELGASLIDFVRGKRYSRQVLLVTDDNVGPLYGEQVAALLAEAGLHPVVYAIPAGESSKTLAVAEKIYTCIIEHRLDRKSPVFALGGGVVGDLAGFVASTYMRGVPFLQLPTSLLAQVDSSVGGKVAVDHALGKNLIGSFYQPDAVFIDLDFMKTLPKREIATGLGEIVKYGIIYDASFFAFLEQHPDDVLALAPEAAVHMIARSCEIKAAVVSQDEKEAGLRRILNFGHTMAHTIEQETGYVRYNHGEAVAIGMVGAADISRRLGLIDAATQERVVALIRRLGLPTKAEGCMVDAMYAGIFHDKKTVNGTVNWVLMDGIGRTVVKNDVPEDIVRAAMAGVLA
ncbi:MAG: 3-dehydroquinate synthase [Selenomonas sp.]|uniref:3-dehydroquinate synthase n=1 Tax=Selenomonas sp. TaxID=2053611 RepID=UPI0025CE9D62|nr:3-dehydroquinate synthase [Selenomonas sp.]MCI6085390.1 3-dehydroquinate synthase [Selenomonas sp.]MDY4416654.1 3-dehydroquinate synthase [Selenomonas sp.]